LEELFLLVLLTLRDKRYAITNGLVHLPFYDRENYAELPK